MVQTVAWVEPVAMALLERGIMLVVPAVPEAQGEPAAHLIRVD